MTHQLGWDHWWLYQTAPDNSHSVLVGYSYIPKDIYEIFFLIFEISYDTYFWKVHLFLWEDVI